jgi:DNA-binding transcriptional regulator YiaG
MQNLATALKAEVSRLARKELKAHFDSVKKALAAHRAEIAALRKRVGELEAALKRANRVASRKTAAVEPVADADADGAQFRFRSAGMASNRKRLALSAADFGLLVGTTGQTIYAWEAGKAKPRGQHLAAIAALRGVGKREVAAKLAASKSRADRG